MQIARTSNGRRWLMVIAALLLSHIAVGAPNAQAADGRLRPARLDVTGWTRLAGPTALPGPSAGDGVGPGSYLLIDQTDDSSYICTANFLWRGPTGTTYLGAAGHCFLPSEVDAAPASDPGRYVERVQVCVSGCAFGGQLGSVMQGTMVDLGRVAYARQSQGGEDVGNDFGLVIVPTGLTTRARVPVWGGPTGAAPIGLLEPVCVYGNAAGLGEVFATKARFGVGGSTHDGAWFATMPSFQGDSGSAVVNCPGLSGTTAVGILTHLATDGTGVIAGTTVARAKAMAAEAGLAINLVTV